MKTEFLIESKLRYRGKPASVRFFAPTRFEGGSYVCRFELRGMPKPKSEFEFGLDGLQALIRAIYAVEQHFKQLNLKRRLVKGSYEQEPLGVAFLMESEMFSSAFKNELDQVAMGVSTRLIEQKLGRSIED